MDGMLDVRLFKVAKLCFSRNLM